MSFVLHDFFVLGVGGRAELTLGCLEFLASFYLPCAKISLHGHSSEYFFFPQSYNLNLKKQGQEKASHFASLHSAESCRNVSSALAVWTSRLNLASRLLWSCHSEGDSTQCQRPSCPPLSPFPNMLHGDVFGANHGKRAQVNEMLLPRAS